MATPNILAATSINGAVVNGAVTTSAVTMLTVAADKLVKVNAIYLSNIHASNNGAATIDVNIGAGAVVLANALTIVNKSTLSVLPVPIFLDEGDVIRVTGDANSTMTYLMSYEIIDDA